AGIQGRHRSHEGRGLRRHRRHGRPHAFPFRGVQRRLRGQCMARRAASVAMRWIPLVPIQVRQRHHVRPGSHAARDTRASAPLSHGRTAVARSISPSLVLAGIATTIAVSFNTLLPVVPVLMERGGPHGAAGAATAALFVGAVAGELITPWLMSRWSSARLLVAGQLMTAVPSLVYVPQADASLMLAAAATRGLGMG